MQTKWYIQKVPFYDEDYKFQNYGAYVVDKHICRRYLLLQGLCVTSVKTTTYVSNAFKTSFCARDHKTNQDISNLNRKF